MTVTYTYSDIVLQIIAIPYHIYCITNENSILTKTLKSQILINIFDGRISIHQLLHSTFQGFILLLKGCNLSDLDIFHINTSFIWIDSLLSNSAFSSLSCFNSPSSVSTCFSKAYPSKQFK
jgi:hypothetical protein